MSEQSNSPTSPPAGTGGPAAAPGKTSGGGAKSAGLGIAGDAAKAKAGGATNSEVVSGAAKQGVQKVAEAGVKKATGSEIAVDALHSAQKVKNGDVVGGAQNLAASGANAATTLAVGATGVGAPVATLAGSAAGSLVNSKVGRYAVLAVALFALVAGGAVVGTGALITAGSIAAISSVIGDDITSASVCSDGGSTGGGPGPSDVVGGDIEEKVWNYLRGAGYTEEQTAGVMGNIKRESQFNPWAAENASTAPAVGKGWGLVQWTADRHASVRDAVIAELGDDFYVGAPSIATLPSEMSEDDVDTMVLFQMRYIIRELETNEQAAGRHLAGTTTVEDATRSFESKYERAGVVAIDERIANAKAYFEQYSGSPVPDAGGTSTQAQTDTPSATMMPQDVASAVGESGAAGCGGSSIIPSGQVGQVAECPSGAEGCVNIAALTKPSASLSCPDGTSDHGTTTAYYKGTGVQVRLCTLDGATDASGRPIIMNAMIAPAFVAFWNEAEQAGIDLSFTSTYRSHAKQESLYASSPGGAARPGWSNHEFGMAFDIDGFPAPYSRYNCGTTDTPEGACSYPGTGAQLERWKKTRALGLKHGMYIHDEEFWHIEFIPSGLHRGRNIDVHQG